MKLRIRCITENGFPVMHRYYLVAAATLFAFVLIFRTALLAALIALIAVGIAIFGLLILVLLVFHNDLPPFACPHTLTFDTLRYDAEAQ